MNKRDDSQCNRSVDTKQLGRGYCTRPFGHEGECLFEWSGQFIDEDGESDDRA